MTHQNRKLTATPIRVIHMATQRYRLVFSALEPPPDFNFHTTQDLRVSSGNLKLDLHEGVLTLDFCEQILRKLLDCPSLDVFSRPVDETRDRAHDYAKTIKTPMDLRTLQDRLYTGQITTVGEFKRDLDLIWNNCITFNGPDHELSLKAREAREMIDETWGKSKRPDESSALEKVKEMKRALDDLYSEWKAILKIDARPQIPPPKKFLIKEKEREEPPPKPVEVVPNLQQRRMMAETLSKHSYEEMRKAWEVIKPHLKQEDLQDKDTFSLNDLPDDALIELKKIVLS